MKINFKLLIPILVLLIDLSSCQKKNVLPDDKNTSVIANGSMSTATTGLTLDEANKIIAKAISDERINSNNSLRSGWDNRSFSYNGKILKFKTSTYGDKPSSGRSLYISMHGGGAAMAAVNDEQWDNQVSMTSDNPNAYGIKEGVVIIPRAPVDDWNMWFQSEIDDLFERAIRAAVLFADVNPNKVYIIGYSAGGDGTFRLSTRMADHWAAASMSAGHPGECTPANLRNIGFALNMGGLDNSFNRNGLAVEWKVKLNNLQKEDPKGYRHMVNIFADKPHWMDMKDKIAISFIKDFTRNPYPDKVLWEQNSFHIRQYFYWLGISAADTQVKGIADDPTKVINVSYIGNTINIEDNYSAQLLIYLNDKMMDLNKEVTVNHKGSQIFKGMVGRSAKVIAQTASDRKDDDYIFSAKISVINNKTAVVAD